MYKNATLIEEFLMKKAYKLLKNSGKLLVCFVETFEKSHFSPLRSIFILCKVTKRKKFFLVKKIVVTKVV
jgi:hypothetical protein